MIPVSVSPNKFIALRVEAFVPFDALPVIRILMLKIIVTFDHPIISCVAVSIDPISACITIIQCNITFGVVTRIELMLERLKPILDYDLMGAVNNLWLGEEEPPQLFV